MVRHYILPLLFLLLNASAVLASADGRSGFCLKELAKAKNIVIVANDELLSKGNAAKIDSLNTQLDNAVRKYWKATKANFVNKNLKQLNPTDLTDVYISLIPAIDGMPTCLFFTVTKKGQIESWPSYHLQLVLQKNFTEVDIIWAVRQFNEFAEQNISGVYDGKLRMTGNTPTINYRLAKENLGQLKTKTLLIDKQLLPKEMTEARLKAAYPYKLKVTDKAEIEEAVLSNNPQFAYLQTASNHLMGTSGGAGGEQIISTQNGHLLSYSSGFGVGWEKMMKEYAKNSETYP